MNNRTVFVITAPPALALKRLTRAGIPVYDCKKQGARFAFAVPDEFSQKVFAIFKSPCYNTSVQCKSAKVRLIGFVRARVFAIIGCILFIALAIISNMFVFRVEVTGSGAYLKNAVLGIARRSGLNVWAPYSDCSGQIISGVLRLPAVTFCSVNKSGSVVYIDVQTEQQSALPAGYVPLISDCNGKLVSLAAVCGTPVALVGEEVKRGDTLIAAVSADGSVCAVSGYAVIECAANVSYGAEREEESALRAAYAAAMLYSQEEQITEISHTVRKTAEGVIYEVNLHFLHTIDINI